MYIAFLQFLFFFIITLVTGLCYCYYFQSIKLLDIAIVYFFFRFKEQYPYKNGHNSLSFKQVVKIIRIITSILTRKMFWYCVHASYNFHNILNKDSLSFITTFSIWPKENRKHLYIETSDYECLYSGSLIKKNNLITI